MNYATIDSETTKNQLVYDLGIAIHDEKGNVLETVSFVISDVFNRRKAEIGKARNEWDYPISIYQYDARVKAGYSQLVTLNVALGYLKYLMAKYKVKHLIAYNASFDKTAIAKTCKVVGIDNPIADASWLCSMKLAKNSLYNYKSYRDFVTENDLLTKTGRIPYSAEKMYAFITDDASYKEEHTALEDVKIEVEIFARCKRTHCKISNCYL